MLCTGLGGGGCWGDACLGGMNVPSQAEPASRPGAGFTAPCEGEEAVVGGRLSQEALGVAGCWE